MYHKLQSSWSFTRSATNTYKNINLNSNKSSENKAISQKFSTDGAVMQLQIRCPHGVGGLIKEIYNRSLSPSLHSSATLDSRLSICICRRFRVRSFSCDFRL